MVDSVTTTTDENKSAQPNSRLTDIDTQPSQAPHFAMQGDSGARESPALIAICFHDMWREAKTIS